MTPLRIGVNALYLIPGGVGGTEIYLRHLLRALAELDRQNQYFVFTNRETDAGLIPDQENFTMVAQPVRASLRPVRILWEQTALPLALTARQIDVLLNPGFTSPLVCGCAQVTVFHDLQHKRHPEYFRWFDLPAWRFLLYWSAHLAVCVIADSEATAADLARYYRLPRAKIQVVPLGVDAKFFEIARMRRPERLLLSVSTLHPHKNLDRLLRAFASFRRARPDFRLIIAGLRGFDASNIERLRESLKLTDAVELTGWIPREKLYELYARADAFLFPSTFEGFGLPVLEAMAAGIPTACSRIEPLATTAGNAALLFDPADDASLFDAMMRLVSDEPLRAKLIEAGPVRARRFSWITTARLTLATLVDAAQHAR